jgi:hypothetical protein
MLTSGRRWALGCALVDSYSDRPAITGRGCWKQQGSPVGAAAAAGAAWWRKARTSSVRGRGGSETWREGGCHAGGRTLACAPPPRRVLATPPPPASASRASGYNWRWQILINCSETNILMRLIRDISPPTVKPHNNVTV